MPIARINGNSVAEVGTLTMVGGIAMAMVCRTVVTDIPIIVIGDNALQIEIRPDVDVQRRDVHPLEQAYAGVVAARRVSFINVLMNSWPSADALGASFR